MSRRTFIRILAYLISLIVVLSVMLCLYYKEIRFYKMQVQYTYSQALEEFSSSINSIALNLEKAGYITTGKQMSNIATTVYTEAKIAKQAFSQFPSGEATYEKVNKFLSQVGNYSISLAQKVIKGTAVDEEERKNLYRLSEISTQISKKIINIEGEYNNQKFWFENLSNEIADSIKTDELSAAFLELEETLTDYPTLIYDGPYSDFISNNGYWMLENNGEITEEEAKTKAASVLKIPESVLKSETMDNGKIKAYNFDYGSGAISVSVNGGFIVYFRKYTTQQQAVLNYEQAISKAQKYLSTQNDELFTPTYYYNENGVCVISFAGTNGNTVCYTDLIKIGVDMSNGEIVFYEGRGYLTNHKPRTIKTPVYTEEQARTILNESLTVISSGLVLIPTDAGDEKHCYEFTCRGRNSEEILVYINTETLEEEDILMVIKTNGGILTK